MTNEDQIVALLTQIRDQQKTRIELAHKALAHQATALEQQRTAQEFATNRLRAVPALLVAALVLVIAILLFLFYRIV
jgi:type VI protein secretion system component VasF